MTYLSWIAGTRAEYRWVNRWSGAQARRMEPVCRTGHQKRQHLAPVLLGRNCVRKACHQVCGVCLSWLCIGLLEMSVPQSIRNVDLMAEWLCINKGKEDSLPCSHRLGVRQHDKLSVVPRVKDEDGRGKL